MVARENADDLTNQTVCRWLFSCFALQFLESFLDGSQRLRLAVRMKGLYRAIMGNPTGFYTLDLSSAQGRLTAIKVRASWWLCCPCFVIVAMGWVVLGRWWYVVGAVHVLLRRF